MDRPPSRESGDRSEAWRRSYLRGHKDPFVGEGSTNRRRLSAMGAFGLAAGSIWLDLGAGDGNVATELARSSAGLVIALEYQEELLACCSGEVGRVVGSAVTAPVRSGSVDAVLVMDVLHHLAPGSLADALDEVRRCLRPRGRLLVCEPAPTLVRRALQVALMSPLAGISQFSRDKRTMVELEADTLVPWLDAEAHFVDVAADAGFALELSVRRPLHTLRRFVVDG